MRVEFFISSFIISSSFFFLLFFFFFLFFFVLLFFQIAFLLSDIMSETERKCIKEGKENLLFLSLSSVELKHNYRERKE
jgi:hypothetical protein